MSRGLATLSVAIALLAAACSEQVSSTDGTVPPIESTVSSTSTPGESASTSTAPESTSTSTSTSTTTSTTSTSSTSTTTTTTIPTTTVCDQVVHIGDSTSVPLFDASSVGGADATMTARYNAVGVTDVYPDNDGGRSIIERVNGAPSALDVAEDVRAGGYDGCWVLMIGTNDAANIAAGSNVNAERRIRELMGAIGTTDKVVWVDTVTQRTEDEYRNASMVAWNQELYRVTAEYPNVRVFRWRDVVRPEWFRNDGIHYTVEGSAQRAALTAQSLVTFFPG